MATKTFYVTKPMKDPTYRHRMLKAGDAVELDGPNGRFYTAIGHVTDMKPKLAVPREVVERAVAAPKAPRKRRKK